MSIAVLNPKKTYKKEVASLEDGRQIVYYDFSTSKTIKSSENQNTIICERRAS